LSFDLDKSLLNSCSPSCLAAGTNEFYWRRISLVGDRKDFSREKKLSQESFCEWKGYPEEENSWVSEYNLVNAQQVLDEFYNAR